MTSRRKILKNLAIGASVLPVAALIGTAVTEKKNDRSQAKLPKRKPGTPPPTQARGGDYFPNIPVLSQNNEKFMLYDDLINNKVVMLNFMSIKGHQYYPATTYLTRIADKLGNQLGQDVFIYSITTDPKNDSVARLKSFATQQGAMRKGWLFLTSNDKNVEQLSYRLYKHKGHAGHSTSHPSRLVHYGNASVGIWAAFGVDSEPGFAVSRLAWVQMPKDRNVDKGLRRAGPRRLSDSIKEHNRVT